MDLFLFRTAQDTQARLML